MSFGKLGQAVLSANANATVYTVPANCLYAEVNINVLNGQASDATIKIAVAAADTPVAAEYIEDGVIVPALGGTMENTGNICSPGEKIVVRSTQAGLVVRVSGREIVSLNP